ncbi:hypothetical protein HY489_06545 [Candidatus Woesearchaeota archaeon]|nr:hypothetical protein [Candidatus Woesearchaeota archaeon]
MKLIQLYGVLLRRHGPQGWWPTRQFGYHSSNGSRMLSEEELLEICIGAVLTQNTSWKNVEKALDALFGAGLVDLEKLSGVNQRRLASLIRSSGYFRQKAKKLKLFAQYVLKKHGSMSKLFDRLRVTNEIREELLSLWGVGPETADSMLLYAGRRPVFVVDAYTKRICSNLDICSADVDYHELQGLFYGEFEQRITNNEERSALFNEFHALFVAEGKSLRVQPKRS